ncbi:MAG TPA: DUF5666 domain-containing protein [Ktedonobacteraceae bacterium]|nr:DUF5666 domain-containing protein [Ktedonobacteraceae bacterium]
MNVPRIWGRISPGKMLVGCVFLPLALFLLAGCGSNSSSSTGSSNTSTTSAAATATACAQARGNFKTATGTISSIQGSSFVVATTRSGNVTVTYSTTTRFTREDTVPVTSLKEGTFVTVAVASSGSTYTATRITVTSGTGIGGAGGFGNGRFPGARGTPGAGRANNPCFSRGQTGTPGPGTGTATTNFRGLIGTVSQVTSSTLVITDTSGGTFSVTITPQTQVLETTTVTPAALKTGAAVTVSGSPGSNGEIAARTVTILLKLPASTQTQ